MIPNQNNPHGALHYLLRVSGRDWFAILFWNHLLPGMLDKAFLSRKFFQFSENYYLIYLFPYCSVTLKKTITFYQLLINNKLTSQYVLNKCLKLLVIFCLV